MRIRSGHRLILLGLCALSFVGARAAEVADSYAVVALVGDAISVVQYRPVTTGNASQNVVHQVPLSDRHFDETAKRAALAALRRAHPGVAVSAVDVPDDAAFGDGEKIFATGGTLPALLDAVRPALPDAQPHWLVVISKYRDDARLQTSNGTIGAGKLAGLGFYVDPYLPMRNGATGERGRGFVASYAYLRVDLVDRTTGAVVRSQTATQTATRANAGPEVDLNPWDKLSADEKVRLLDNVLRQAVQQTVTRVAAPA